MKKSSIPQIEIEFRAILEKKKYDDLKKLLKKNACDLGRDNKVVHFFLLPDRIVKVVKNISKKTAKVGIKLNRLGKGTSDFEEIEIPINPSDFDKTIRLFSALHFDQIQNSFQKRHNYEYNGVELALKHSESWGYHVELEIVIDDISKKEKAEVKIRAVADELGIRIMTEKEITDFAKRIDKQYKKGFYNKKTK